MNSSWWLLFWLLGSVTPVADRMPCEPQCTKLLFKLPMKVIFMNCSWSKRNVPPTPISGPRVFSSILNQALSRQQRSHAQFLLTYSAMLEAIFKHIASEKLRSCFGSSLTSKMSVAVPRSRTQSLLSVP